MLNQGSAESNITGDFDKTTQILEGTKHTTEINNGFKLCILLLMISVWGY
jgi:hypothetical protein